MRIAAVISMLSIVLGLLGFSAALAGAGGGGGGNDKPVSQAEARNPVAPEPVVDEEPAIEEPEPAPVDVPDPAPVDVPDPAPVDVPDPAPVDVPDPAPVDVPDPVSTPPQSADTNSNDAGSIDISDSAYASIVSGRVATLDLGLSDTQNVKILSGLDYGNVTVNSDNTLAVVLTGTTETTDLFFSVEITEEDGSIEQMDISLDVMETTQAGGWGTGQFYMLEVNDAGDVVVEHGENHREVYVSASDDALTLNDIAALEGLDIAQIDGDWLRDNPEYGSDPDIALAPDAGMTLWYEISHGNAGPNSNWLLFERGYEYDLDGRVTANGAQGESEIHPQLLTAYGEGADPIILTRLNVIRDPSENVVVQGLDLHGGAQLLEGSNMLFDDISITGGAEFSVTTGEGITLRNSDIVDNYRETPVNEGDTWAASPNRVSSVFAKEGDGLLLEGIFIDHTGWGEGYDPENGSVNYAQPPSYYSQNFYIQKDNLDVTFRDNISVRAASMGAQIRSGGMIEDNVFLDNNGAVNFFGGPVDSETGIGVGNYTLFADNVITSGAHKTSATHEGALTLGIDAGGSLPSLVDNIVAHLANPDDPSEQQAKVIDNLALNEVVVDEIYYNDTVIYNWIGQKAIDKFELNGSLPKNPDTNVENLDEDLLDQTTIQRFAAQLLGQDTATIDDLANYLRTQDETGSLDNQVDADVIISFFQEGFGLTPDIRSDEEQLRFEPNALADGIRWDNRLNWSTEDLPGTQDGDSVELAGNWVHYGGTTRIAGLEFGDGGKLDVTHGYLEVEGHLAVGDTGAELNIDNAGQFWTNGYADKDEININVDGGRFANTGLFSGTADITVSDNAQAILASDNADFLLGEGSSLTLNGGDTRVGFDGEENGTGVLLMSERSELNFVAEENQMATIREFYSGHFDDKGAGIQSGVNLGMTTLNLDVTNLVGAPSEHTLIDVDELIGDFGGLSIQGLGTTRDASVEINYDTDTVTLQLGQDGFGSGAVSLDAGGDEDSARSSAALWDALTNGHGIYDDDPVDDIPVEEDLMDWNG